jgi:hypothetical protein
MSLKLQYALLIIFITSMVPVQYCCIADTSSSISPPKTGIVTDISTGFTPEKVVKIAQQHSPDCRIQKLDKNNLSP